MLHFLQLVVAKITSGWVAYTLTAIVATTVTGGSIVALSASGVINITSGLGQHIDLPFTFKPSALGTLDQVYGSLTAGASAAITGAGVQLPALALSNKIAAVSNKIIAEANADKASLQKLAENAAKSAGFKGSDEGNALNAAASATSAAGVPTLPPATSTVAVATSTPVAAATLTPTRTVTATASATQTPTATGTATVTASPTITATPTTSLTPTPTGSASVTPTVTNTPTPTPTRTPSVNFSNSGQTILTFSNMIPGGPGVVTGLTFSNTGAHPFNYTMTTSCSPCNILFTNATNGLQLAIDQGTAPRSASAPTQMPGGDTNMYTGPISATAIPVATGVNEGSPVNLGITVWLPAGPATNFNALTPNAGNAYQALSVSVTFTWNASE